MRYLILSAALLLAGCATPASMREGQPDLELASPKPMPAVAACITDAWEATPWVLTFTTAPVTVQSRPDRVTVQLREGNLLAAMADVTPTTAGSSTRFYYAALKASSTYAEEQVRRCQ